MKTSGVVTAPFGEGHLKNVDHRTKGIGRTYVTVRPIVKGEVTGKGSNRRCKGTRD